MDLGIVKSSELKEIKAKTRNERKKYKRFKWKFLLNVLGQPFIDLWKALCCLYYDWWQNRKKILKISFIVFIVYSIFTGIKNIVVGTSFWLWCKDVLKALILFVAAKGLFFAIHYLFGYQVLLARERELSDRFVNEKMAKIAKISGATGAGKDTFMRYVGTAKRNALIKKLKSRSKYIQKTVYWVSFDVLNELIENDVKSVDDYSKSKYAELYPDKMVRIVAKDFLANEQLIKQKYKSRYNARELSQDYSNFKKAPRFYKSKYIFDEMISSSHVLDLLSEYVNIYFRLNIDKHFIMTNQPTIEDMKEHLMCKQFSLDYFKLIHDVSKKQTQLGTQISREKVIFGLTENMIILESEVDSFYNNLDKSVNSELLKSGVRDAFAYNRHLFGEDFSYYQVGQNASRCASLMRELTHEFIYIEGKKIIDGGRIRNFFIKLIKYPFDFILDFNQLFYDYKKQRMKLKKEYLIKKYNLKYQSTHKKKWQKKAFEIDKIPYPAKKGLARIAERFTGWCERTIQKNKNNGWIEMKISLSKSAQGQGSNEYTLKQILNKDLNVNNAIVKIVFKRVDSHGLYDTHYLKALKKNLVEKSEVNFYNAKIWDTDMVLKKEDSIYIDYKNMDKFFNNTREERFQHSYEVTYEDEKK